jgi:hypothetical protein
LASRCLLGAAFVAGALGGAWFGTIFFPIFKHHLPTGPLRITAWAAWCRSRPPFLFVFRLPMQAREERRD